MRLGGTSKIQEKQFTGRLERKPGNFRGDIGRERGVVLLELDQIGLAIGRHLNPLIHLPLLEIDERFDIIPIGRPTY